MFDNDIKTHHYNFEYQSAYEDFAPDQFPVSTRCEKQVIVGQDVAWPIVAREFASFLSSVYGYNISEKLYVKVPGWAGDEDAEFVSIFNYE